MLRPCPLIDIIQVLLSVPLNHDPGKSTQSTGFFGILGLSEGYPTDCEGLNDE